MIENYHVNLSNATGIKTRSRLTTPTRAIKVNVKSYTALIWTQAGAWTEIIVLPSAETELHFKNTVCLSTQVNTLHNEPELFGSFQLTDSKNWGLHSESTCVKLDWLMAANHINHFFWNTDSVRKLLKAKIWRHNIHIMGLKSVYYYSSCLYKTRTHPTIFN